MVRLAADGRYEPIAGQRSRLKLSHNVGETL